MWREMFCCVVLMGTTILAQTTTAPVRAEAAPGATATDAAVATPPATVEPAAAMSAPATATATPAAPQATTGETAALRQEVAELKAELARLRGPQAGTAVKADTIQGEAPVAAPVVTPPTPQPVLPLYRTAGPMESRNVKVSNVKVTDFRQSGKPGITITADVTLNNVPDVPYTFEASLVTPNGQTHTDVRGRPYTTSREIRTGDDFDTDDYSVWMDLSTLFSSRPPEDLYVQVRVLDLMGRPAAASQLHTFRRPWK